MLLGFSSVSQAQELSRSPNELRVLFIGNSLTYVNDLPEMVAFLAKKTKLKKIVFKMIAEPNYGLEDHWKKERVHDAISKGKWDFVVLQQGPSASKEGRQMLLDYSIKFAAEIKASGARPALYMVWPPAGGDLSGVVSSYTDAAKRIDALLLPAGLAWLEAMKLDRSLKLYADDGFHPSQTGTYLAALVICQGLLQSELGPLPVRMNTGPDQIFYISASQADVLKQAARSVLRTSK